jgi:hypothetical protein
VSGARKNHPGFLPFFLVQGHQVYFQSIGGKHEREYRFKVSFSVGSNCFGRFACCGTADPEGDSRQSALFRSRPLQPIKHVLRRLP